MEVAASNVKIKIHYLLSKQRIRGVRATIYSRKPQGTWHEPVFE